MGGNSSLGRSDRAAAQSGAAIQHRPFLSTRLVHYHAAFLHNLSPPLTVVMLLMTVRITTPRRMNSRIVSDTSAK
jgi:hypothetical protein